MSGYLEVKYPLKSNIGLNPFKSWKRQWCILRPSPTFTGGMLAVYCSEAGASAGAVELPSGCVVRRSKSRTRPHAFAVFAADEPRKPRVLLAASTLQDAQNWMEKIKSLLNGREILGTEIVKDSYSVTVTATKLSRKCGLSGADSTVSLSSNGVFVSRTQKLGVFIEWSHISDVAIGTEDADRNGICVLTVDSEYRHGAGQLRFSSPLASELAAALRETLGDSACVRGSKKLSKSEGDLRISKCIDDSIGEVRPSSWYSGPSEVSLDDLDLVMSKECKRIPVGQLSRCSGAGHLAPPAPPAPHHPHHPPAPAVNDSMSDRRSLLSVASGIYEEIPELPAADAADAQYCRMSRDVPDGVFKLKAEEPTYESVAECVYATMRRGKRHPPPPLPPRSHAGAGRLGRGPALGVTRHCSLGALPQARGGGGGRGDARGGGDGDGDGDGDHKTKTLPRWDRSRQAFSAFRKRLKSDSRTISPKSDTTKEKYVETKKKKFDFTPSRDIFKSFKVSRKMKNLKIAGGTLGQGGTRSCECLERGCSSSAESLQPAGGYMDELEADLSIEFNDDVAALSLPQEIVDLILAGRDKLTKIRLKDEESEYMPMSPIIPPPAMEHHYIVMSPRANIA